MAEDLTLLKSDEACIVRNPLAFSYGETELERTSFVAGDTISVAGRYFSGQSCNLWLVRYNAVLRHVKQDWLCQPCLACILLITFPIFLRKKFPAENGSVPNPDGVPSISW